MIRYRVHMIIAAEQLPRPISFRTDVFLAVEDDERAYELARRVVMDQDPLTAAHVLSATSEKLVLGPGARQ